VLTRLNALPPGGQMVPPPDASRPRLWPDAWPSGVRMPDGVRPTEGLSALERRKLAERLVASLRAIGLDCQVLEAEALSARSELSGQPC